MAPFLLLLLALCLASRHVSATLPCTSATSPCELPLSSPYYVNDLPFGSPDGSRLFFKLTVPYPTTADMNALQLSITERYGNMQALVKCGVSGAWPQSSRDAQASTSTSSSSSSSSSSGYRSLLVLSLPTLLPSCGRPPGDATSPIVLRVVLLNSGSSSGSGSPASGSLVAAPYGRDSGTPIGLTLGQPLIWSVPPSAAGTSVNAPLATGTYAKFAVVIDGTIKADDEYILSLTPLGSSGDPNVRVSDMLNYDPKTTGWTCDDNHVLCKQAVGFDYVRLPRSGTWYVYVSATSSSSSSGTPPPSSPPSVFVLVVSGASRSQPTLLLAGVPMDDSAASGKDRFYVLEAPPGAKSLSVVVTPLSSNSDPDVFLNNPQAATFYYYNSPYGSVWESASMQVGSVTESISFSSADPHWSESGGKYYLTIHGFSAGRNDYSVTPSFGDTAVVLKEGVTLTERLEAGKYRYYQFYDTDASSNLIIDVSPISGDPDLYVACKLQIGESEANSIPSAKHFNFSSTMQYEDAISISHSDPRSCLKASNTPGGAGGAKYFIAVFAFKSPTNSNAVATEYKITAVHEGGIVQLQNGVPQQSDVYRGLTNKFKFRMGDESRQVKITVHPTYGDPDLFVYIRPSSPTSFPTSTAYDFSSVNDQYHDDSVTIHEEDMCTSCVIHISVGGFTASRYTILVSTEDVTTTLQNGRASRSSANSGQTQLFKYTAPRDGNAQITLTALGGMADLVVSRDYARPNSTHVCSTCTVDRSTRQSQVSQITVPGLKSGDGVFVGVTAASSGPSQFTVQARSSVDTAAGPAVLNELVTGVPQDDKFRTLADGSTATNYYAITLDSGHGMLRIAGSPRSGPGMALYAKACPPNVSGGGGCAVAPHLPTPSNFDYASTGACSSSASQIMFNVTGAVPSSSVAGDGKSASTYIVAAVSCSARNDNSGSYTVAAYVKTSSLMLAIGVSVNDFAHANSYSYFKFFVSDNSHELFVSITSISGDCDLYLSTKDVHPSRDSYEWKATNYGSDAITIYPDDPKFCSQCWWFIGIFGFEDSHFSILTQQRSSNPTVLYTGQPQYDHVRIQASNQYVYMYTKKFDDQNRVVSEQIQISITPSSGDPDLFAIVSNGQGEGGNGGRGHPGPTLGHYDYSSQQLQQTSDRITIDTASDKFNRLCDTTAMRENSCVIQIGVLGYSASDYIVLVSQTSAITTLVIGTPFRGVADRKSLTYYRVSMGSDTASLRLTLTPTSGHSTLYVSCAPRQYPTQKAGEYDWTSSSRIDTSTSSTLITAESMVARGCPRDPPGDLFIGVFNNSTSTVSSFAIAATIEDGGEATAISLTKGLISSGDVAYHKWTYYSVAVGPADAGGDLTLSTTVIAGDVDMYVSNSWASRPVFNAATNKVESYMYSSVAVATERQTLKIPSLNPSTQSSYIVGVFGAFAAIPTDGQCFDFWVPPSMSCQMLLQNQACGSRRCSCEGDFCPSCVRKHECDATCGLCQVSNPNQELHGISSYTLVADTGDTVIQLMDGISLTATVATDQYKYYSTTVTSPNVDLSISIVSLNGGDPDLYIDVAPNRFPNETNYRYYSGSLGSDTYVLQSADIVESCPQLNTVGFVPQTCMIFLSVYGYNSTRYTITSSFGYGWQSPTTLILGQQQSGYVAEGTYTYYKAVANPEPGQSISFTLSTTDDGDADLFLSASREREPGQNSYDLEATGWAGSDTIKIEPGDPLYCTGCTLYLAVYGYYSSNYNIVFSTGLTSLACGQSSFSSVAADQMAYFSYYVGADDAGDVELVLTALTGDPDVYVTASTTGTLPTKDESMWMRSSLGSDSLTIPTTDHNYCNDCEYIIGVFGWTEPATFELLASSGACMLTLHAGRPQNAVQTRSTMRHYKVSLRNSGESLTTSLVMVYGAADMYIKKIDDGVSWTSVPLPDKDDATTYDVTSKGQFQQDILTFNGPWSASATFIIGVWSTKHSNYLITASFSKSPVVLTRGVPQVHFVEAGETEVFMFNVDRVDADIVVTSTAITGDPDILISSSSSHPGCKLTDPVTSMRVCQNYTWMSADLGGDELTINHNAPCEPTSAGTIVSDSCNPRTVFEVGAFYVGAYGFSGTSKFSILWNYVGGRSGLVPGRPQIGSTSSAQVCISRDESTGACVGSSVTKSAAYYTFEVPPENFSRDAHISFSISPDCDTDAGNWDPNSPGCSGKSAPSVNAYVKWCVKSDDPNQPRACTVTDSFPTAGNSDFAEAIDGGDRTVIFIANDWAHPNTWCNPKERGAPCVYYLAIETAANAVASFSVLASTIDDVTVIPCRPTPAPDGVINWGPDVVATDNSAKGKGYEVCGTSLVDKGTLDISLERCSGDVALMICNGDGSCANPMPSRDDFNVWSDELTTCTQEKGVPKTCVPTVGATPRVTLQAANIDTYFVKVEGSGKYNMRVASYLQAAHGTGTPTIHLENGGDPGYEKVYKGGKMTLKWKQGHVNMNGLLAPVEAFAMDYEVFYVKSKYLLQAVLDAAKKGKQFELVTTTYCGLQNTVDFVNEKYISVDKQAAGYIYVENPSTEVTISTSQMDANDDYLVVVVAKCDEQCLLQIATANSGQTTTKCTVARPCKTIRQAYKGTTVSFVKDDSGVPEGGKTHHYSTILGALFGILLSLGLIAGVGFYIRKKRQRGEDIFSFTLPQSQSGGYIPTMLGGSVLRAGGGYMPTRRDSTGVVGGTTFSPFFVGGQRAVDGSGDEVDAGQIDFAPNVSRTAGGVRAEFAKEFGAFGGRGAAVRAGDDDDMSNSIELGNMGSYRSPEDFVLALKEDMADEEKVAKL